MLTPWCVIAVTEKLRNWSTLPMLGNASRTGLSCRTTIKAMPVKYPEAVLTTMPQWVIIEARPAVKGCGERLR